MKGLSIDTGKQYRIMSVRSEMVIQVSGNDEEKELTIEQLSDVDEQFWNIKKHSNGYYTFESCKTGEVLDVVWAGIVNGARLHTWDFIGKDHQFWSLEKAEDGCFKIASKASGKVIDVVGISAEDGTSLQIWDDFNGENQLWEIVQV